MTAARAHDVEMMLKVVPASAWGVIVIETVDGPEYYAVPEPDTSDEEYHAEIANLQANPNSLTEEDIEFLLEEITSFIEGGEEPTLLHAAMTIHGRICIVKTLGTPDNPHDSFSFIPSEENPILEAAKRAIENRTYGAPCDHVLSVSWFEDRSEEAETIFMNAMDEVVTMASDHTFIDALIIQQILNDPDDSQICQHIDATVIEAPVTLEIFDIALEAAPGRAPTEAQKEDFERHILAALGEPPEHDGPQSVRWQRLQIKIKAEEIRSAMGISMVYIAAYTETQEILLGLARKGKKPVLLLSLD